ncbi:hypothetical protein CASFOL_017766 [Castilleja foliolosa]|uniref:GRAM domain-containing protein n=1 Tax=Castilleja foliolosa TaxID=1961234 RepID=A0ABD3DBY0_9LAMI
MGPKFSETVKGKLSVGAKIIKNGGRENIFRGLFGLSDGEKLLKASQCYLSTTSGPIAGLLFTSTQKVGFCSERSISVQSTSGPGFIRVPYKENLEVGSSTKVVDCILALKDYHEWKQMTGGNEFYKPPRSPIIVRSSGRIDGRDSARQLDMSRGTNKPLLPSESDIRKLEEAMVKALAQHMSDAKENMDSNLAESNRSGSVDPVNFLSKILSRCLEEQFRKRCPEQRLSITHNMKAKVQLFHGRQWWSWNGSVFDKLLSYCRRGRYIQKWNVTEVAIAQEIFKVPIINARLELHPSSGTGLFWLS